MIAAASIAPMASASGVTALAFNQSTYNGTACGTITGAYVTVTEGGVPKAGESVTVSLSGGYTFSGGSTTNTEVSGPDGRVNLPAIVVPAAGGPATLTGTSGSETATAAISATSNSAAYVYRTPGQTSTASVPAGSIPLNAGWFLYGTTLYDWQGNHNYSSDVLSYSPGWVYTNGTNHIAVTTSTGQNYIFRQGGATITPAVPNGSTPLNSGYFLKNGTLYHWEGNQIATNVAATSTGWTYTNGVDQIAARLSDGKSYIYRYGQSTITASVPDGSTPLDAGYFLKNGTLYHWEGNQTATNVTATSTGWTYTNGVDQIAVRLNNEKSYIYRYGQSTITASVPDGSTPLDAGYFLKNGTLYHWEGNQTATNVTATSTGWTYTNGVDQIAVRLNNEKSYIYRYGQSTITASVPDGSTPLNAGYFLKNGTLYHWEGNQTATNVGATSTGWTYTDGSDQIDLTKPQSC
ncbi:hypothetical protein D8Y23_04305 [Microbacterium enclense]|uniref:Uncharacterized protein n=1 Tax=Microbacterium enclense TaxID=993073 RepID=A0A3S3LGS5_9MICO|nr:hypothetical protein D8Y23_04305 [Microbacterium enclense]